MTHVSCNRLFTCQLKQKKYWEVLQLVGPDKYCRKFCRLLFPSIFCKLLFQTIRLQVFHIVLGLGDQVVGRIKMIRVVWL